jgi:biopolymer transport protein ExbB/TolQ
MNNPNTVFWLLFSLAVFAWILGSVWVTRRARRFKRAWQQVQDAGQQVEDHYRATYAAIRMERAEQVTESELADEFAVRAMLHELRPPTPPAGT